MLHALCLGAFYRMSSGTCLEISTKSASFNAQAPGLADSASVKAIEARHQQWAKQLPQDDDDLWPTLVALDSAKRRCLRTARRSPSMPCMSGGTATRSGLPMPTRSLAP
jgi:ParB family chromosome partitioning protein